MANSKSAPKATAAAGGKKLNPLLLKRQQQKKQPAAVNTKPLPPPVEVPETSSDQDAYQLAQILQNQNPEASPSHSASSSTSEPKPGEPLSQEAEHIVADIGGAPAGEDEPDGDQLDPAEVAEGLARISFDEAYVRDVLEEAYGWMADKFDSDHWALTERQSRMLGGPTTQLLGSVWMHAQRLIPEILARWANSTPGLMDFVLVFGLVTGPKVAKQFAVSRQRRQRPQRQQRPGAPVAVPPRMGGPVGPMQTGVEPFSTEGA